MITIELSGQTERVWLGENPAPALVSNLLYHQWRTYLADGHLIVNTYNTGTGKTRAALLRLLKRAKQLGYANLYPGTDDALLIAPTNELLNQHYNDAREFCDKTGLPYRVVKLTREDLQEYRQREGFSEEHLRNGEVLRRVLQDPRSVEAGPGRVTLFVVNPDIFYYVLYYMYGSYDRTALFKEVFDRFNYVIIDEFHYYNPKQFANFLFFLQLSQENGYFNGQAQRQICLLTATPSPEVRQYLERLGLAKISWITPETEEAESQTTERIALTSVHLQVYTSETDGLKDGLISLVQRERLTIAGWLNSPAQDGDREEGAIISGALWRISQIYQQLVGLVGPERLGRITGPESRAGRQVAKSKPLILATPTVDIGYNFERDYNKKRQNIDFLLFDARTGDEFIQRLGRAGRVLAKSRQDQPSRALAMVPPDFYAVLKPFDGQTMSRAELRRLAEANLPTRNALFGYIQNGAIAEAFYPLDKINQLTATEDQAKLRNFYETLRQLFAERSNRSFEQMQGRVRAFQKQVKSYGPFQTFPAQLFECWREACPNLNECKTGGCKLDKQVKAGLVTATIDRVREARKKGRLEKNSSRPLSREWLLDDLRCYHVEKARFSFRESFGPPTALVYDSNNYLTSERVRQVDALQMARNFRFKEFEGFQEWQAALPPAETPSAEAGDNLLFVHLLEMRPPGERLKIGLRLDAGEERKKKWDQAMAYRLTALYNLEVVALNHRLGSNRLRDMFKERFVPALVAEEGASWTAGELKKLAWLGQVFSYDLEVMFADNMGKYQVVLGTLALQVWAELLYKGCLQTDARKTELDDFDCLIF